VKHSVIASNKATKQSSGNFSLDCFAELAIGPATSGRTRWLAMTNAKFLQSYCKLPQKRWMRVHASSSALVAVA
jgi:hypothetical protein